MSERTFVCDICGHERPWDEHTEFDSQDLCTDCLETHTVLCHECRERLWTDENAGSRDIPLCQDCYDDNYTHCCRCGHLLRENEAYYESSDEYDERPYCTNCYYALDKDQSIHDYYYKPEAVFHGKGPRFFGVELEIDGAGERAANALALLNIANRDGDCAYIKHDGSLNEGLEIVTIP